MDNLTLLEVSAGRLFGLGLFRHRKCVMELCQQAHAHEADLNTLKLESDGLRRQAKEQEDKGHVLQLESDWIREKLQKHEDERKAMQLKMDGLLDRIQALEDERHVLQLELADLHSAHDKLMAEHGRQRKGVGTLLQFIHSTHRLNLPVAEGTILEAIRKGQIK